jgi:hypothetical protein
MSTKHARTMQCPERALWISVALQSVRDYLRPSTSTESERNRSSASDWLFGDDDADVVGSFAWVASMLDMDADSARSRLRAGVVRVG